MEKIPLLISLGFIGTVILTGLLLYRAGGYSRALLFSLIAWLGLQGTITLTGFYQVSTGLPPRFMLLLIPPVIAIVILFLSKKGRGFIDKFDNGSLTLLHLVRIPVELVLFGLFVHHAVPKVMTFEGRNLDILSGLTAPAIYYFGYIRRTLSRNMLLLWNIICLGLLINIVATAIFSAPFVFQQSGFEQPNVALFYFPFSWLPGFVVPAVLLAHLISIRKLVGKR